MAVFQRYVSVDWSGRGTEHERVPLGIATADRDAPMRLVHPPGHPAVSRWKRTEIREWLGTILGHGEPKALVALDFGLGLLWGADREVLGCASWRATVRAIANLYAQRRPHVP